MIGCRCLVVWLSGCFVVLLSVWKTVPPPGKIRYIRLQSVFVLPLSFFPRTRIYKIDTDGSLMG